MILNLIKLLYYSGINSYYFNIKDRVSDILGNGEVAVQCFNYNSQQSDKYKSCEILRQTHLNKKKTDMKVILNLNERLRIFKNHHYS